MQHSILSAPQIAAGDVVKPGQPVAELGAGGAPAAAAKPAAAAPSAPSAEAAGPAVEIVVPSMGASSSAPCAMPGSRLPLAGRAFEPCADFFLRVRVQTARMS